MTSQKTKPAPTAKPETAPAQNRASETVPAQNITSADIGRNSWFVKMRPEDTIADLNSPRYLGLGTDKMRRGDFVEFANLDLSIWAQAVVLAVDPVSRMVWTRIITGPLDLKADLAKADAPDFSKAIIEQAGPTWRVRVEHQILRSDFASEESAAVWLKEKSMGVFDWWAVKAAA